METDTRPFLIQEPGGPLRPTKRLRNTSGTAAVGNPRLTRPFLKRTGPRRRAMSPEGDQGSKDARKEGQGRGGEGKGRGRGGKGREGKERKGARVPRTKKGWIPPNKSTTKSLNT